MTELKQRETGGESSDAPVTRSLPSRVGLFLLRRPESTVAIAALFLGIYFALANEFFLTSANIRVVANNLIPVAILATGQTMLLISGEIDLSQGAVYFMTPFLAHFAIEAGVPLPVAILVAVLGAGIVGVINSGITIYAGIPSFIVTLAMLFIVSGFTLNISNAFPVPAPSEGLAEIFGGAPFSGLGWAILIVVVFHIALTKTRWGVYTIAIGDNRLGAREAGVPANRITIRNFVVSAMVSGFAGIIEGIRIDSFDPGAGGAAGQRVFMAVAAAVIGGTVLTGGYGTIIGAFLGALVLAVLRDGFTIIGVSAFTFSVVLGAAILVAMVVNEAAARVRIRSQSAQL
jgi:simple sugar transport system permease protein